MLKRHSTCMLRTLQQVLGSLLSLSLLLCCLASSTSSAASSQKGSDPKFTTAYDELIWTKVSDWWQDFNEPYLAKAQMFQESGLNPKVCSSVGACGFGQFMPGTWGDVIRAMHWSTDLSRFDVEDGIEAFVWYQGRQRYMWRTGRNLVQANELGQANYNAGAGHILKAQKLCGAQAKLWESIVPTCLVQVTGVENAKQTIDYTYKIRYWYCIMLAQEGSIRRDLCKSSP